MSKNLNHLKIIGHRGGGGGLPENSLASIKFGIDHNCDIIEIDVHQTADSVIVLCHDKKINRTTNGKGTIKNLTYNALMEFDLLSNEDKPIPNEKIPSLDQVIKLLNGKTRLLIEVKLGNNYYPNIENQILNIIHRNNAQDWCIIQSFNTQVLKKFFFLNNQIELHKVCFGKLPFISVWITDRIEFLNMEKHNYIKGFALYYPFINRRLVRNMHNSNKVVNAWTVDKKNTIIRLNRLGIDGIITNYPELIEDLNR